jgi:hypothetical protein
VGSEGTEVRILPPDPQSKAPVALAVFWPAPEHEAMTARWPQLAAFLGTTWDECRRGTERYCVLVADNGLRTALLPGDAAGFEAFLAATGIGEPSQRDLLTYPDLRTIDRSCMTSWPPASKAACWCGSGARYKRCCRPRGPDLR